MIKKNIALSEEILRLNKKISRYVLAAQIMSLIKFLIILAPIILALIYLPPLIKNFFNNYSQVLPAGDELKSLQQYFQQWQQSQ